MLKSYMLDYALQALVGPYLSENKRKEFMKRFGVSDPAELKTLQQALMDAGLIFYNYNASSVFAIDFSLIHRDRLVEVEGRDYENLLNFNALTVTRYMSDKFEEADKEIDTFLQKATRGRVMNNPIEMSDVVSSIIAGTVDVHLVWENKTCLLIGDYEMRFDPKDVLTNEDETIFGVSIYLETPRNEELATMMGQHFFYNRPRFKMLFSNEDLSQVDFRNVFETLSPIKDDSTLFSEVMSGYGEDGETLPVVLPFMNFEFNNDSWNADQLRDIIEEGVPDLLGDRKPEIMIAGRINIDENGINAAPSEDGSVFPGEIAKGVNTSQFSHYAFEFEEEILWDEWLAYEIIRLENTIQAINEGKFNGEIDKLEERIELLTKTRSISKEYVSPSIIVGAGLMEEL